MYAIRSYYVTDLLHLGELLQQASAELAGEPALLRWLNERCLAPNGNAEDQQLRLESERKLVQVVTIHKSKGLHRITSYNVCYTKLLRCDQLTPFAGILPYVEIEGQEAELLGRLASFFRQIRTWRDDSYNFV